MSAALREVLAPAFGRRPDGNAADHDELLDVAAIVLPGILAAFVDGHDGDQRQPGSRGAGPVRSELAALPDLAALELPIWIPIAARHRRGGDRMFGGIARLLGVNLIIVLAVPFCLAGLAVLHTAARRFPRPAVVLSTFYVLAGLFGWPFLLIALLGLRRIRRSDLRRRLAHL